VFRSLLATCLLLFAAGVSSAPKERREDAPRARIEVRAPTLQGEAHAELASWLMQRRALHEVAGLLNARLRLPRSVGLRYAECGEVNAWYDPATREVRICLELVERLAEDFGASIDDDGEFADAVDGAARFIALHEVGHALVDVLEIPVTGREEDAVDQLSAWLLLDGAGGADAVLSAAAAFALFGEGRAAQETDFADQHSLDQQRYYNMLCWVYGSAPARQRDLVDDGVLPAVRAEACEAEFAQLKRSWKRLLAPHLRANTKVPLSR
jgi:hypothetical protein